MDRELLRTLRQATKNHARVLYHRLVSHLPHLLAVSLLVLVGPRLSKLTPAKVLSLWREANVNVPALVTACWAAAVAAYTYAMSRPRPVYLVDLAGYKAPAAHEASRAKTIVHFSRCGRFSEESMLFQKRMLERSGLGEATYFPMSLISLPVDMCLRTAKEESDAVIFGVVDEILRKAGVAPGEVGVLIFNSSLLSPTPSFTSLIVNRYRFRDDVVTHNLSGMGCSAGIIAIDLAKRLLQVHPNTYALVVSTENITLNAYMGNNRPMLVTNTLFRVGGAAILLSNRRADRGHAKYQLIHTVRTHRGAHDQSFGCVTQEEDEAGEVGVSLSKELMVVAGEALKTNITTLGPLVLPMSEQLRFLATVVLNKVFRANVKAYLPVAGLTIASLCIPQDIGYAKLANLPPEYGLYSSFVPPLIYALMGSSRHIAIGPVAVVSLLLGTMLQDEIDPKKNPLEYSQLAFTATFFAGITQATLGFFRLGFIIEFLSHAAIVGFMAGAAITIALQQLKGFLGIANFTKKTDIVSVMKSVWGNVHHGWNWQTILIGASFLTFLLVAKYIGKKKKKLFWVSAIAPLISVIISTFFVYITHADKHGVAIVKDIKKGINPPSASLIYFTGPYLMKGFRIGVIAGMIGLTEAIAIGRTFAGLKDYQIDGNKEMMALGTMNVVGSMTSCYIATGSFSRSAVNYMAGCQTAVSNVVMSIVVLLTLELITPLFKYTPNAILSSIIISAVIGLIDYESAYLIWKVDKLDFVACLGAFLGVVFASVEYGLLIAVAISLAKILIQVTRPRTALLGNLPRTTIYRNIEQYPEATKVPGILIVRVDSAIYFTNSNYVKERILRWLRDEEERQQEQKLPRTECLIVELSPVIDIDTSGIHALEELFKALEKRQIQLILANPGPAVIQKLRSAKFTELIGDDKIFLAVGDAVKKFAPKAAENV